MKRIILSAVLASLSFSSVARADWNVDVIEGDKMLLVDTVTMKTKTVATIPGVKEGDTLTNDGVKDAAKRLSFEKRIAKLRAELKAKSTAQSAR